MAQVTQKTPPTRARAVTNTTVDAGQPARRFRLPSFLSPNNPDGTPRSGFSRLALGMIVLFFGFYLINFLLSLIYTHLPRGAQDSLATPLASKNTFLLGGLTGVELIFFLAIAVFYVALFRFNIIPRDPFNTRARTEARLTANRGATSSVNLSPQTRASRRQAAAAVTTTNASSGKNGKSNAKAPAPLMKTKAGQSAASASAVRAKPALSPAQSGAHDAEYERVKALQRQQRRREAKR